MKRTALFALMISLLLGGCSRGAEDEAYIRRCQEDWQQGETVFSVSVLTQTENTAFSYEADCTHARGETAVTLTAPADIAGVRFRSCGEERALSYDGAELLLGEPGGALTPAMAVPVLMDALTEGYLFCTWREDECLAAQWESGEYTVTLWMKDGCPLRGEIAAEGCTAAQVQIDQWHRKEA